MTTTTTDRLPLRSYLRNTLIIFAFMATVALIIYLVANAAGWVAGYNQGWNDGIIRPFDPGRMWVSFIVLFTNAVNLITMVVTLIVLFGLSFLAAKLTTSNTAVITTAV